MRFDDDYYKINAPRLAKAITISSPEIAERLSKAQGPATDMSIHIPINDNLFIQVNYAYFFVTYCLFADLYAKSPEKDILLGTYKFFDKTGDIDGQQWKDFDEKYNHAIPEKVTQQVNKWSRNVVSKNRQSLNEEDERVRQETEKQHKEEAQILQMMFQ